MHLQAYLNDVHRVRFNRRKWIYGWWSYALVRQTTVG